MTNYILLKKTNKRKRRHKESTTAFIKNCLTPKLQLSTSAETKAKPQCISRKEIRVQEEYLRNECGEGE